ncbi:MAG: PmoA family protein [Verrucomicrobiales bacterium]
MKIPSLICSLAGLGLLVAPADLSAQIIGNTGGGWSVRGSDPIMIFHGDDHVTSYHAGNEAGKPYFYPVIGPTGEHMTRHWPMKEGVEGEASDHIHHRGMWYGLGNVNGLDFWHFAGDGKKKDKKFGSIRHVGMNGITMSKQDLAFTTKSEWLAEDDPEKRVLSDRREFRLFYRKDGALVVDATIELIADAGDVTIRDDKEGAWSIRTQPTLRLEGDVAKGSIVNSEGVTGKDAWGKRAAWVDYFGPDQKGNPVGIAILDHPSNFRHPTWWHARHYGLFTANPFGQGNFEKDAPEGAGNHTIENGDSLTFRYRTIFHEGDAESAEIAKAFEAFAAD